ncbi:hypothetical protein CEE37_14840 [candidate division LCP-89 bacterium B3_LCP]|uniref:Pyridoxamine 5'-phosphate oxidase N-terminal domain-containing protein n=1 Tax=candidate division LCP-89 bacterium B3_LCP TaxID=2012998 RepID=A0A532UPK3_UNCL8|nr:MAG: hypothetical protein CEE37_14840 [candidate division LCP-89 bacterium B3_LCP]
MSKNTLNEIKLLFAAQEQHVVYLATLDSSGHPRVRPVTLMVTPSGYYIATSRMTRKAAEIRECDKVEWVTLFPGERGTGYIRFAGNTIEVFGQEKRQAVEENDYPVEKYWTGIDDPDFVVFRIEPERVEFIRPGENDALDVTDTFIN